MLHLAVISHPHEILPSRTGIDDFVKSCPPWLLTMLGSCLIARLVNPVARRGRRMPSAFVCISVFAVKSN